MAEYAVDDPSICHDFETSKTGILKAFKKLNAWREETMQEFRNMQLHESEEKSNQCSGENKTHFQSVLENKVKSPELASTVKKASLESSIPSSVSGENKFECYDTLQESSITGHFQNCFDDSSENNPSAGANKINIDAQELLTFAGVHHNESFEKNLYGSEIPVVKHVSENTSDKKKRPFLKKGTGLLRYTSEAAKTRHGVRKKVSAKSNNFVGRNPRPQQKSSELKPVSSTTNFPTDHSRHVRFDIPKDVNKMHTESPTQNNQEKSVSNLHESRSTYKVKTGSCASSSSSDYIPKKDDLDLSVSENESPNSSKENRELEEFEMLENCAQNSSFNSDSSLVQRILNVKPSKPLDYNKKKAAEAPHSNINGIAAKDTSESSCVSSIFSPKIGLSRYLDQAKKEINAKKLHIQSAISEQEMKIQSLQNEMGISNQESSNFDSDMSKLCSKSDGGKIFERKDLPSVPKVDSHHVTLFDLPSSSFSENNNNEMYNSGHQDCNDNALLKSSYPDNQSNVEEEALTSKISHLPEQNNQVPNERSYLLKRLQEKEKELEIEIKIYQQHNANLTSICKERDEVLKKLEKERENFDKFIEAEKKKLEAEFEEKQRQFRREKETFTRLRKQSKETSTRKDREELNTLRQEVEKLKEELKHQNIKHRNETRKLRNQLDTAEKEKDHFKQENIRMQEVNQDLLVSLKARMKKRPDPTLSQMNKKQEKELAPENHTQMEILESDMSKTSDHLSPKNIAEKKTKPKVRFCLENDYQSYPRKHAEALLEQEAMSSSTDKDCLTDMYKTSDYDGNLTVFKENDALAENLSRSSPSNESDSKINHRTLLENGLSPLKEKDYTADMYKTSDDYVHLDINENIATPTTNVSFSSATTEPEFKETDHGSKIERIYRNGERVIRFRDGSRKFISADGKTTKFYFYNGDTKEILPDKREITKFVNGITETKFPDGLEVTVFPNGQIQKFYPGGKKEVMTPDGAVSIYFADGSEEIRGAGGDIIKKCADGTETIELPNGQREIRTATYRRREFPNGAVKIAYSNGRVETRFSNGRIRIKDSNGKLIVDTKYLPISRGEHCVGNKC